MRISMLLLFVGTSFFGFSQALTVEKIMRDPKWIGSSPKDIFWSYNGKAVLFQWNPDGSESDSTYQFLIGSKAPQKVPYREAKIAQAIHDGVYNTAYSQIAYVLEGDIYLLDIASGNTRRITQTKADESAPQFVNNGENIAYQKDNDLYIFVTKTGLTQQVTSFAKGEPATAKQQSKEEQWLQQEALQTSDVLQRRKENRQQEKAYLDKLKQGDTVHVIYTGNKQVYSMQASPDARFVSYQLLEDADDKKTVVPAYVTESGYTTDIPARSKVGAPQGTYSLYVFDRKKDTVIHLHLDSLPGLSVQPLYKQEYKYNTADSAAKRDVYLTEWVWNDAGSTAIADIRSLDFKDRWLMQFDTAAQSLKTLSHQHDEAWIGGPGIGWLGNTSLGFINDYTVYYFSEATGYSQLYSFNLPAQKEVAITQGNYEVQSAELSRNKQSFYLVTNEEHPGKQSFYRINTDGTNKQKLTTQTGGYNIVLSPDEKKIAYRFSYQTKPWELFIQDNGVNKAPVQITHKAASEEWSAYPWRDTKIFTFAARDGAPVYARIYEPAAGKKNGAAVIFVHGAGYLQNVDYRWSNSYFREAMFNNLLADKGYTVLDIDYRASEGYGRNWRTGIYRHMGGKDLDDEVDAARFSSAAIWY